MLKDIVELYVDIYNIGVGSPDISDHDKKLRVTAISKLKQFLTEHLEEKRADRLTNKYLPANIVSEDVFNYLRGTVL